MIEPEGRLWVGSGSLLPRGPYTWYITDLDQRRHFAVTYAPPTEVEDIEATEDVCIAELSKHVDDLGPGVFGIRFTEPDGPITLLTGPEDDMTVYLNNYPLSTLGLSFPVKTVYLTSLTELDRLGPDVDLVSYAGSPSAASTPPPATTAAFKYWFMQNGMFRTWYELNSLSRLPRDHPHIVPFDSVVLDPHTDGIVGFTTRYIPGGTLHANNATTRPFRLAWLRQLLSAVDDLNYQYGMMHQDIAARNLLIDEADNLRIFDLNYSVMIERDYTPARDDVKGVVFTLYEIITLDEHFRDVPHEQQDAEAVLNLVEWPRHLDVKLDADVAEFRAVLDEWVAQRRAREFFKPAETWVRWPMMPEPPLATVPTYEYHGDGGRTKTGTTTDSRAVVARQDLVELGAGYWEWERPASYRLKDALAKRDPVVEEEGGVKAEEV
ncbi:hypothetical protein C8A05DRAFT_20454 [Staphylotrichum tortipilum]|uniref:EKC/KEOPS complex subunit BUD32 n=1 Tax=Staphylotrichum tortipilum TaxID=2831512 RepID=A0AAN6MA09_9PEZI|nr:hypothetical protein C8A05DRAFT_20454 [Staphylotrichum longicolle]